MRKKILGRLLLLDLVILNLGLAMANWVRFELLEGTFDSVESLILIHGLWSFLFLVVSLNLNTQNLNQFLRPLASLGALLKTLLFSFVGLIFVLYFLLAAPFSRVALALSLLVSLGLLLLARILAFKLQRHFLPQGFSHRAVFVVGDTDEFVQQELQVLSHGGKADLSVTKWSFTQALAHFAKSFSQNKSQDVWLVNVSSKDVQGSTEVLEFLSRQLIELRILSAAPSSPLGGFSELRNGYTTTLVNELDLSLSQRFLKRAFDFVATVLGLIVIFPLLLAIGILIKLTSPGPVFYSQVRVGRDGKNFKMYKFRSMKVAHQEQPGWTTANDNRRTWFGSLLRSTSLDELPQLFNVLLGDMSLVGPRPEQPFFVEQFSKEIPFYHLRHKVPVGITGWAQVNGLRGDTSIQTRIDFDLQYIRSWSLWMDLKILLLTFVKGFVNKNAY